MDPLHPPARTQLAPLLTAAFCAAAGVLLADWGEPSLPLVLGCLTATAVYCAFRPIRLSALLLVFTFAGTAHTWRHNLSPSRAIALRLDADQTVSVALIGKVLDVPQVSAQPSSVQHCKFRLKVDAVAPLESAQPGSELLVFWKGPPPLCGDVVSLRAVLRRISPARNPGQFDDAAFYQRQDLWAEAVVMNAAEARVTRPATGWELQTWANKGREAIAAQLLRGIESRPQTHALISSMVLGLHGDALQQTRLWFRDTGTLHLFAVSGLNLSMLAGFLAVLLRLAWMRPRLASFLALPVLAAYGVVTGLGPSCLRALVMSGMLLASEWIERPAIALNSLGAAALLLLLTDGNTFFQGGFQLSFGLVLMLLLGVRPLAARFRRALEPDPLLPKKLWSTKRRRVLWGWRHVAEAVAVSLVAWVAGLPWSVVLFHQIVPVAILANLVAVPIAFVNLSLGFLALLCAPLGPVTPTLNKINATFAEALLTFIEWADALPGGHRSIAPPFSALPELVVFDMGEGGAVLLRQGGQTWLLDCGTEFQVRSILLPAFQRYGINRLDGLVLSHGDSAHIGGTLTLREALPIGCIFDTSLKDRSICRRHILQWLEASHANLRRVSAGETWKVAPQVCCEVLHPPPDLDAAVADDKVLVLRWSTPNWSLLYTADAGFPTERWLLEHAHEQLHADVWVRGTHAREATGTDAFVEAIGAKIVVVAGARAHGEQAATRAWAEHWRSQGTAVWLQEECGAVEGWSKGGGRFRGYLDARELRPTETAHSH